MVRKILRSVWDEQEALERIAQRTPLQFALFSIHCSGEKIKKNDGRGMWNVYERKQVYMGVCGET
jgi:hypothetical protein